MFHRNKKQRIEGDTAMTAPDGSSTSANGTSDDSSKGKNETPLVDPDPEGTKKEKLADCQESDLKDKIKLLKNVLKSTIKENLASLHLAHQKLSSNIEKLKAINSGRQSDMDVKRDYDIKAICRIIRSFLNVIDSYKY